MLIPISLFRYVASELETSLAGLTPPQRRFSGATHFATADGTAMPTWTDTSGGGFNATQSGSARPTKQTVGGRACLRFDGVDDYMVFPDLTALSDFTAVLVVKSAATAAVLLGANNPTPAVDNSQLLGLGAGVIYVQDNETAPTYQGSTVLPALSVPTTIAIRCETGAVTFWSGTTARGTGTIQIDTVEPMSVGMVGGLLVSDITTVMGFANADIFDVILWNIAIGAGELTTVLNRSVAKYGG